MHNGGLLKPQKVVDSCWQQWGYQPLPISRGNSGVTQTLGAVTWYTGAVGGGSLCPLSRAASPDPPYPASLYSEPRFQSFPMILWVPHQLSNKLLFCSLRESKAFVLFLFLTTEKPDWGKLGLHFACKTSEGSKCGQVRAKLLTRTCFMNITWYLVAFLCTNFYYLNVLMQY